MKKLYCFLVAIVFQFMLSSCSNDTYSHLSFKSEDESIIGSSVCVLGVSAVTDAGNVYYMGPDIREHFTNGISLELSDEVHASNLYQGRKFICIYDKGDAVKTSFTTSGGTIQTKHNEVYLYLNDSDKSEYITPKLLCTGYTDSKVYRDKVYLLSETGEFGFVTIDDPKEFLVSATNIRRFAITTNDQGHAIAFLLTGDDSLYVYDTTEQYDISAKHFDDVIDFDFCMYSTESSSLCILNDKREAYYYALKNNRFDFDTINEIERIKAGDDISEVVAHGSGIAMLDTGGNLYLYGSDLDRNTQIIFYGQLIMRDVTDISGCNKNLFVVKSTGEYRLFGSNGDNTYTPIQFNGDAD